MNIVCLDFEGVLIPEIWKAVADKTGEEGFRKTTRDEPNYDTLMEARLKLMDKHGITIELFQEVVEDMEPLEGAKAFLDKLRSMTQVIILSDTYEQFVQPLLKKLGWPTIFCHNLKIDGNGRIEDYCFRLEDQKRKAVHALQKLNYKVIAAGDSYNDVTMLESADHGILYCPPESLLREKPQLPVAYNHDELLTQIAKQLSL